MSQLDFYLIKYGYIVVWKLQERNVCFGARDNKYGRFTLKQDGVLIAIRLKHESGHVICSKKGTGNKKAGYYWGCSSTLLGTVITDEKNAVIFPKTLSQDGSYTLANQEALSEELTFYDPVRYEDIKMPHNLF